MKKINFLGDSITHGARAERGDLQYTALVAAHFGAEECNFGAGGTRIAKQRKKVYEYDDNEFMRRAVLLPKDADFTFVFGGTNDYGHGDAPLGKFGDHGEDTFYGAFSSLAEYMQKNFGEKLCFILPLYRYAQDDMRGEDGQKLFPVGTLKDYIEAERKVLEAYKIEYLDLSDTFYEPKTKENADIYADGLHPNTKGHRVLADKLIEYLEKRFAAVGAR